MESSDWLFHFGCQGGHHLLHKPFRTKRFAGIGCVAQAFCVAFGGGCVQQFLPVLGASGLLPEGHLQEVAAVASTEMGSRAGSAKPLGRFHQTCTHGIEFDIADGVPEVAFFDGARVERVLPEMPATDTVGVVILGVAAVGAAQTDG